MAILRHSIRQQVWQVGYHNPDRAVELQEEVSRIYYQRLLGVMEEVMQRVAGEDLHLRLGTVELNLGTIHRETLEEDLIARVGEQLLETLLQRQLEVRNSPQPGEEEVQLQRSLLSILAFYLQHGSLPWWDQRTNKGSLESLFFQLLSESPVAVRELLLQIGRSRWVRQRIVRQFSEKLVKAVVRNLEAAGYRYIFDFVEEVQTVNRKKRIIPTSESELRQALWEFVLAYLLVERGSVFNTRSFARSVLRQLGVRFSIPYARLLHLLQEAVTEVYESMRFRASLSYLVRSLYWDEFGRAPEATQELDPTATKRRGSRQRSKLELLGYFLHFGSLPWWSRQLEIKDLNQLFSDLLVQQTREVLDLVYREGKHAFVRTRLAHQFSEPVIRQLMHQLEPNEAGFMLAYADQLLQSHRKQKLIQVSQRKFQRLRWEFLLTYLLVERGSGFNRKMFLASVLRQMAERFNLSYAQLLMALIDDLERMKQNQVNTDAQLAKLLLELLAEKKHSSRPQLVKELSSYLGQQSPLSKEKWHQFLKFWWNTSKEGEPLLTFRSIEPAQARKKWQEWLVQQNLSLKKEGPDLLSWIQKFGEAYPQIRQATFWKQWVDSLTEVLKSEDYARETNTSATTESDANQQADQQAFRDLVLYLLRHGALPWWAQSRFPKLDLTAATLDWLVEAPTDLLEFVLRREWKRSYTRRLLELVGEKALLVWLAQIYAWQETEVAAWMELVEEWSEDKLAGGKSRTARKAWRWYALLSSLSGQPAEQPAWRKVLQTWLQNLSEAYGQEPQLFFQKLTAYRTLLPPEAQQQILILYPSLVALKWPRQVIQEQKAVPDPDQAPTSPPDNGPEPLSRIPSHLLASPELKLLLEVLETGVWPSDKRGKKWSSALQLLTDLTERQWRKLTAFLQAWARLEGSAHSLLKVFSVEELAKLTANMSGSETGFTEGRILHLQLLFQQTSELQVRAQKVLEILTEANYLFFFVFPAGERNEVKWLRWVMQQFAQKLGLPLEKLLLMLVRTLRQGSDSVPLELVRGLVRLERELQARNPSPDSTTLRLLRQARKSTEGWTEGPLPPDEATVEKQLREAGLSPEAREQLEAARQRLLAQQQAMQDSPTEASDSDQPELPAHNATEEELENDESAEESLPEPVYLQNAGLVLTWPYLNPLFDRLGMLEAQKFKSPEMAYRGVHLLQYLATGREGDPEYELVLNKILCGVKTAKPLEVGLVLKSEEKELADSLMEGIIANWSILGDTSPEGLRETFLQREGRLAPTDTGWHLKISQSPYDVLLDQLPWSIKNIRLAWMESHIKVEWRDKPETYSR